MGSARINPERHTPTAGDPDQAMRHDHRASKLFEDNHAYAARLVQIPIAIPGVVRSATTTNVPDQVVTEFQEDDGITVGIAGQPPEHRDDP